MEETGVHIRAILDVYSALALLFHAHPDVYVAATTIWYYRESQPYANIIPDVMVIKGVKNYSRQAFRTWQEKAIPAVTIEITSSASMVEDMVNKGSVYARLGVPEYFLFDPLREYLQEGLLGLRLENDAYRPLPSDDEKGIFSQELGVYLHPEKSLLHVLDPHTDQPLPALEEILALAQHELQRAELAAQDLAGEQLTTELLTFKQDFET